MKFSKLIIGCMGILMASSLYASQDESVLPLQQSHHKYVGYEIGTTVGSIPIVGYRYQCETYMGDFHSGYKYMTTSLYSAHYWKAGISAYKTLTSSENGHFYVGLGAEIEEIRMKMENEAKKVVRKIHPSISLGRDFPIDGNKKVFIELSYRPYEFSKDNNCKDHSTGLRMGVGY